MVQGWKPPVIWGIELRYVLTLILRDAARPMTVSELQAAIAARGFAVDGRASKTISDALRWEVRKGRVARAGWGMYRAGNMPRSTRWLIQQRVAEIELRKVAPTLAEPVALAR